MTPGQQWYHEQLRKPEWKEFSKRIKSRDGYRCQRSGCTHKCKTVVAHHKRYRSGAKPWEYPPEDLITYCADCHDRLHKKAMGVVRRFCGDEAADRLMKQKGMDADEWEKEFWMTVEHLRMLALFEEAREGLGSLPDDAEFDPEGRYYASSEGFFDEDGNLM